MLAAYWEQSFAEEWERLEPILDEEVERASGRDPIELLGEVRAEHMVDVEKRLIVRRSMHHHEVAVEPANPLRLIPSVYVWPHVRVNCDAPWPLAVLYPPATMQQRPRAARGRPSRSSRHCVPRPTRPGCASSSSSASSPARPRSSPRSSASASPGSRSTCAR